MRTRTIENPVIKDRVTFVKTAEETGGAFTEIIVDLAPGGGNELHVHTSFSESFTALEGRLAVQLGKEKFLLDPGQTASVPPGMVHRFYNPSDHFIKFRGLAEPGRLGSERFVEIAYGLARDGLVNAKGFPNRLSHVALLMEMGDMRMPGLAFRLMEPILHWLARRARRRGTEAELVQRYCT
jgi:quercetin dioxygenase-like cupin family protein